MTKYFETDKFLIEGSKKEDGTLFLNLFDKETNTIVATIETDYVTPRTVKKEAKEFGVFTFGDIKNTYEKFRILTILKSVESDHYSVALMVKKTDEKGNVKKSILVCIE